MTTPSEKEQATSGLRPVPKPATTAAAADAPADPAHRYLAGDVITRKYRLTQVLGEGGMGAVWLARNLALDVDVAIKLIRRDIATVETSRRLLQEARAAARLRHPAIVRVFDFGETEQGDPFIVMEVLSGESLADVLRRRGRLSASEAIRTALPIFSALVAAHAQGIVHRDLKPDNVILVSDGGAGIVPKVVDFGIAKLRQEKVDGAITMAGSILGSPDYMSPEQARGRDAIDERTDVWSLSVVLYEMICGRAPFEGPNYNALLMTILDDDPVPTIEFAAGDAALWEIIKRGLEKDVDARWPTMRAMGAALAEWLIQRGIDTDVTDTSLVAHWMRGSLHDGPGSGIEPPTVRPPPGVVKRAQHALPGASTGGQHGLHARESLALERAPDARRHRWMVALVAIVGLAGAALLYARYSAAPRASVTDKLAPRVTSIRPTVVEPPAAAPTPVEAAAPAGPPATSSARHPATGPAPRAGGPIKRPLEIPNNPNF